VYKGEATAALWQSAWTSSGAGGAWGGNVTIAEHSSDTTPALAAFRDELHLVHVGRNSNALWHSWTKGSGA
jgi:hypothetical protein